MPASGAGLAADLVDQMKSGVAADPREGREVQPLGLGVGRLRRGDDAVVLHPGQHIGEALVGALAVAVRIVIGRPLGQAGDEGAFGQRQVLHRLAEIGARREVDAPRRAAEIDRVEIDFEDFLLGERLLDAVGDDHLADLALEGDAVADQQILRHLLGDGRAALALVAAHACS